MAVPKFKVGDVVKLKNDVCDPCNKFIIREIIITQDEVWYGFTGGIRVDEKHLEKLNAYIIKKNNVPYEGKYQTIEQAKRVMRTVAGDEYGRLLREYQDNTIMMRCDDTYAIITILYTEEHNSHIIYEVESV